MNRFKVLARILVAAALFAVAVLNISSQSLADSNATGGVTNSETVSLGAGPFDHAAAVGNAGNSVVVTPAFTGGFMANQVRFTGALIEVLSATIGSEADIQIRGPNPSTNSFNWQNSATGTNTTTPVNYASTQALTGALLNVDPAGTWTVEFFDSFDDGAGADARSSNVNMTFLRSLPTTDSNGSFVAGTLVANVAYNGVGEFAQSLTAGANGNNDRYSFTIPAAGTLDARTFGTSVFTGNTNGDTEIAIFDSLGNVVPNAFNDDGGTGNGLYSELVGVPLAAGSYTLVVGDFDTNFSNTSTLSNLTFGSAPAAGYDYGLRLLFVPEPVSALYAVAGLLAVTIRRRR